MEFIDKVVGSALDRDKPKVYSLVLHAQIKGSLQEVELNHQEQGAVGYLIHGFTLFSPKGGTEYIFKANGVYILTAYSNGSSFIPGVHANFFHLHVGTSLKITWNAQDIYGTIHYQYIMYGK